METVPTGATNIPSKSNFKFQSEVQRHWMSFEGDVASVANKN